MKQCKVFCHKWAKLYTRYTTVRKLTRPTRSTIDDIYIYDCWSTVGDIYIHIYDYLVEYLSLYDNSFYGDEVTGKICLKCRKTKMTRHFFTEYNLMLLTEELKHPDKRFSIYKNTKTNKTYVKEVDKVKNKE